VLDNEREEDTEPVKRAKEVTEPRAVARELITQFEPKALIDFFRTLLEVESITRLLPQAVL
jgi:hypothetical protein